MRRIAIAATAVGLAGCPPKHPEAISVRAFAAPPDDGSYVLFYQPWRSDRDKDVTATGATVRTPLEQITVECVNVKCTWREQIASFGKPLEGVDKVELIVRHAGHRPTHVQVPIVEGNPWPKVLVMMKPEGTP
jgi:hypothetical protein